MYSARAVLNDTHSPAEVDAAKRRGNAMHLNGIDAGFLAREEIGAVILRSIARATMELLLDPLQQTRGLRSTASLSTRKYCVCSAKGFAFPATLLNAESTCLPNAR